MGAFVFTHELSKSDSLRKKINDFYRKNEAECLNILLKAAELPPSDLHAIYKMAEELVLTVRKERVGKGGIDAFLYQYDLSTDEGIALMCLAEATLRIPDVKTIDSLISDKLSSADWQFHRGKSDSSFVNAASWALMLTGKLLTPDQADSGHFIPVLKKLAQKTGAPMIRKAVGEAMKIMGRQFVMGRTIDEALDRSRDHEKRGYRFSYDMLGEAARTAEDAERYFQAYQNAIASIGNAERGKGIERAAGISVKLSALYPRYELAQRELALPFLKQRLKTLAVQAKAMEIGLTVDAEEADRLELSLDIIEAVISDPALKGWNGFGLAVQAYQKRAFYVIDWLADLAKQQQCRLMVRLVKGAYWDFEIKDSQVKGLEGYPVFTRKINTDVSYLACAKKIIAYGELFYPQFATHNAYTVAAIITMMGNRKDFEFQCLKGMGRALYDQIVDPKTRGIPCRMYAPVGQHEDLLPYLVRRLLENGANTSFVNRIVDEKTPVEHLIANPVAEATSLTEKAHTKISLPVNLFGNERKNSLGVDLSNLEKLDTLAVEMEKAATKAWRAIPSSNPKPINTRKVINPSDHTQEIGTVVPATIEDLEFALTQATKAAAAWDAIGVNQRADYLEKTADLMEAQMPELMALIVREGGKTIPDAVGEVREAIDFCRYYAMIGRKTLSPIDLPGPTGETNQLCMHGRGVFLCISPWNFPLAIFVGQVAAALVAGNCVLGKPAEQTSLIAAQAIDLMHAAGIPKDVVQLVPGKGSVIGAAAIADSRIAGVMFTGSTETARGINQVLANRQGPIVPFIAETGGQNAMIADSTALPEQLVMDVITSAFNSAGQRCSALRVLFLQEEMADKVIAMLKGAMAQLKMGNPCWLNTDIGPVIDLGAKKTLEEHAARIGREGKLIAEVPLPKETLNGTYFAPRAYEIPNLSLLTEEVFGPILHVIRYPSTGLDDVIDSINATGYGLTVGVHTRINAVADYIHSRIHAGNAYINRNMIGAVVGVQPFGGEGLSGTGPKAGGPHYLLRLCHERTLTVNTTAAGGNATLMSITE